MHRVDVAIPFVGRINPDLPRARSRHLDWVCARSLIPGTKAMRRYAETDFAKLAANVYPLADGPGLDLATDALGWAFLFDDRFDEPGPGNARPEQVAELITAYREVTQGGAPRLDDPRLAAFAQLWQRFSHGMSPAWLERHVAHWDEVFSAFVLEARNNAQGRIPDLDEYFALRRGASGPDCCFDWIERIGRFELPAWVHQFPDFLLLRRDATDVVMLVNDLFSVEKERDGGNTDNIVLVLLQQEHCSWAEAVSRVTALIAETVLRYQAAGVRLRADLTYRGLSDPDRSNVDRFLVGLEDWMKGSLDWHVDTVRYLTMSRG